MVKGDRSWLFKALLEISSIVIQASSSGVSGRIPVPELVIFPATHLVRPKLTCKTSAVRHHSKRALRCEVWGLHRECWVLLGGDTSATPNSVLRCL